MSSISFIKYRDPSLNRFRQNSPEAVGGGVFSTVFRYNFRPDVDSDVISDVAVDDVDVDVREKFGDLGSNGCGDNRGAGFVSNERTNEHDRRLSH